MLPNSSGNLLQDKVVVITGSSQGIGRGIALGVAKQGAKVVLHYLGDSKSLADVTSLRKEIDEACGPGRTISVGGDVSDPQTAKEIVINAVEAFGRIDSLVSNAGICPFHQFLDLPHSLWHKVQDVNLNGAFYVVQAVANQMSTQHPQGGTIVAISSISALVGGGEQTHYTPTKAGVKSLMESCAIALAPHGIRCNSVLPGTIETEINREDLLIPGKREAMVQRIPLARLGKPEDLAGPVIFFLSDLSSYVTGSSLLVDGGAFVSLQ